MATILNLLSFDANDINEEEVDDDHAYDGHL